MAEIRKAELEDLDRVVALLSKFPPDPEVPGMDWKVAPKAFPELVRGERGVIFLSEEDGQLAGLVTLSFPYVLRFGGAFAQIEDFIVDDAFRGRGIASPLLKRAFDEARARGCPEIQVNGASEAGTPVYIRNGMHQAGTHLKAWL